MKTWDILCIRNYSKYNEQINPSSFESTVSILFHTVSRHLGHSWLNTPQKRNYKERLETNSKNIFSKTKTVNLETKDQHKIKIGNILYPEFGNELPNTWNESPKKKSKRAWGFETIPSSTNSSCLGSVIWAPATHGNSKQVVSKNIIK